MSNNHARLTPAPTPHVLTIGRLAICLWLLGNWLWVQDIKGQGYVGFANRIAGGAGVGLSLHIWGPSSTAPGLSLIGLGSNDRPSSQAGLQSVNFAGSAMGLIGSYGNNAIPFSGANSSGRYGLTTTFAQLIGADGSGAAELILVPLGATTTFKSGTALGSVTAIPDTLTGNPAIPDPMFWDAAAATFEIVAWDNSSGAYPTWAEASVAWRQGLIAAGHSLPFVTTAIGGSWMLPPDLNNRQGDYNGMTSFNLYFSLIPEPSTFALAGLGAAALLILRCRK